MARADDTELIDRFEEFYRNYYRNEIGELAQQYPTEEKSLYVDWRDLYRFDPDLADDLRTKPGQLIEYAEEALRLYDLPVDVSLGQAHVRIENLPETTGIREIRHDHHGRLISVQGIVRKATDVRPKITDAAFECQRCGTLSRIPQTDGDFQEPHECQGCERQGPFRINFDQSEFVDAQKLRIQESPEGLRGGETPQNIDINIEDDITGEVTAGDHVEATGTLKLDQRGNDNEKSPMFDVYMDGLAVSLEDEQFEEMDITDEDKKEIVELSNHPNLYERMRGAIAPSIYGYENQKLAMVLQLFSGVTKHLPDESRIRGDLHMLLIGDPGTGKCVSGDTTVTLGDGRRETIRQLVEGNLDDPKPVDDGVYDAVEIPLPTLTADGRMADGLATRVWKREAPDRMYRIETARGRCIEVTPSHPLFVQSRGKLKPRKATELSEGEFIATPKRVKTTSDTSLDVDDVSRNTNTDIVPDIGATLQQVREKLALTQADCGLPRSTYQHYERGDRNPSRESLSVVVETFEDRLDWLRQQRERLANGDWHDIECLRDKLGISQDRLASEMDTTQSAVSYCERNEITPDGGHTAHATAFVRDRVDRALSAEQTIRDLRALVESDVRWDRIESIECVVPEYDWVYDLEVAETHSYVSNGIVSHNSQLLQYIRRIAPRSVYSSGKGASTAGLTAAAVRDDFGDGQQWTLEAGALVLADQGIAAIDELDKMDSEDRSAMHEALEQQSISINKAGINAVLKSRCSLLGAANPKYGRFDQYESIAEQIDLEPALISRFDLIFTVTDKPNKEEDAKLAEHILTTNYAGELHTHRTKTNTSNYTEEEVETVTDEVAPTIEPELLRKYVAYAKRNCFPTMTDVARAEIRDFYVDLRSEGAGEDSPVPVTARKLEALVRLAEASARVRLSDDIEVEDAERAVRIARHCLEDIGLDPETGEYDADMIETGTSKSQRDRIKDLLSLIADIEAEYDEGAPVDVVIERAEEGGMEPSTAEHEIEKLKQKGEVYEPRTDHLRTT